jgi:hypothetical protein
MNDEDDFRETPMLWYYEYEQQCNGVCTCLVCVPRSSTWIDFHKFEFHFDFTPTFFYSWNVLTLDSVISLFHEFSLPILWKFLSWRKKLKKMCFFSKRNYFFLDKKIVSSAKEIFTFEMSAHLIQRFLCFTNFHYFVKKNFLKKKIVTLKKPFFLRKKKHI